MPPVKKNSIMPIKLFYITPLNIMLPWMDKPLDMLWKCKLNIIWLKLNLKPWLTPQLKSKKLLFLFCFWKLKTLPQEICSYLEWVSIIEEKMLMVLTEQSKKMNLLILILMKSKEDLKPQVSILMLSPLLETYWILTIKCSDISDLKLNLLVMKMFIGSYSECPELFHLLKPSFSKLNLPKKEMMLIL